MFNTIINIIRFHYPKLIAIYVYGSYARGTEYAGSDVDISILMPLDFEVMHKDKALNNEITETIGKEVNCVFCTQENQWCEKIIYKQ